MSGNLNDMNDSIDRLCRSLGVCLSLFFLAWIDPKFSGFGEYQAIAEMGLDFLMLAGWIWAVFNLLRVMQRAKTYRELSGSNRERAE